MYDASFSCGHFLVDVSSLTPPSLATGHRIIFSNYTIHQNDLFYSYFKRKCIFCLTPISFHYRRR
ncbi:hypothetical protein T06_15323, partial [Trichinella sp. T6]